ncbi:MAG TPA: ATP-binding protein [Steroidobacteraceae bacterium]|jgi:anti-sigma regulatory factor (Ser/Thr protein kinase)|nr:ATP-binding protein [Steroidobacteraceae bacterium]
MATEPFSQLVLRADLEELSRLESWLGTLSREFLLSPLLAYRLDICLTELMTNVIGYAFPDGTAGTVAIRCWRDPDQIVVRMIDDGAPFDPTSYVSPDLPKSLAEATVGGWGVRLVRQYADELCYRRSADANQLTLVFRWLAGDVSTG